jgi:MFS family permease
MTLPRDKSAKVRRLQWISVGLLLAVGIVNILDRSTLAIANSSVGGDLHLSPAQMGLLLSAFSWAYAFSQLPIGVLLDRIGARIVLGIGLFCWSVAQLCGGLVISLRQFLTARVFLGIGEAPTYPAGAKIIADWFNKRERGGPTGIFLSSPTIGPMIAPPIITAIMLYAGWRWMFIAMGATGIVLSALWFLAARDRQHTVLSAEENAYFDELGGPTAVVRKLSFAEWRGLFAQRTTWGIVLGFVGAVYMVWLYLTWLPAYLAHERHLSIARTGWVAGVPYLFGTLGTLFAGYFADYLLRHGMSLINSRKWPVCMGLLGGAFFTIPVAYTKGTTAAVAYLCVAMFFLYMASGGAWAMVNVATPNHMIATVGGLQNFGGYFGGSFAPVITGFLVERTHSFRSALIMSSVFAFASALFYFFLITRPISDLAPPKALESRA